MDRQRSLRNDGKIVVQPPGQSCPYFESKTITLPVPSGTITLNVPFCRLSEIMGQRLNTLPAGQDLVRQLTSTPREGETRFIYGPDMNPITAPTCSSARLQQVCQPAFVQLLTRLALEATLPRAK